MFAQKLSPEELNALSEKIRFPESRLGINLSYGAEDFTETLSRETPEDYRKILEKYSRRKPRSFAEHKEYADALDRLGHKREALKYYTLAEKIFQDSIQITDDQYSLALGYGKMLISLGLYESAVKILTQALPLGEDKPEIYSHIGVAYIALGNLEKGKELFQTAIRKAKPQESFKYYVGMITAEMLRAMHKLQQNPKISFLEELQTDFLAPAYKLFPEKTRLLEYSLLLGGMLIEEFSIVEDPENFQGIRKNASYYPKFLEIEKYCLKASTGKFRKQPHLFKMLQIINFLKQDIPASYENYKKYIALNPYDKEIYENQTFIFAFAGKYDDAIKVMQEKQKYLPASEDFKTFALLYFKSEDYDKATEYVLKTPNPEFRKFAEFAIETARKNFSKAVSLLNEQEEYDLSDRYYYLAIKNLLEGNREKAKQYLQKDKLLNGAKSLAEELEEFVR